MSTMLRLPRPEMAPRPRGLVSDLIDVIELTCVDGTWAWEGLGNEQKIWSHPDHLLFSSYLRPRHRITARVDTAGRGFVWSTNLVKPQLWKRLVGMQVSIKDWEAGAVNDLHFHQPPTVEPQFHLRGNALHQMGHSHGGNPPYIAAAIGLHINVLITVCTPIRWDVIDRYGAEASTRIGYHIHYWSENDRTQRAGGLGDGRRSTDREHPTAHRNIRLPEAVGHSGLLTNPSHFHYLEYAARVIRARHGRLDYLSNHTDCLPSNAERPQ